MAGENNDKGQENDPAEFTRFLAAAEPAWLRDGKGVRGDGKPGFPRPALTERNRTDQPIGDVRRGDIQGPFPQEDTAAVARVLASLSLNCSFLLVNATTGSGETESNKVLVMDGKVNGQFPAGMGFGNYILDLADPGDAIIYVEIDFTPTTLGISGLSLGVSTAGDMPESRVESVTEGFVYVPLGFTYFNADGAFTIWQQYLGDINFAFGYGAVNGARGLLPMNSPCGWLDTEALA